MAKHLSVANVTAMGVRVEVEYRAFDATPGNREEPGEPAGVEIEAIRIGGEDVDERHLSDDFLAVIEAEVMDVAFEGSDPNDHEDIEFGRPDYL